MTSGCEIINPVARVSGGEAVNQASGNQLEKLEHLRLGLLDNGMPHADAFLQHIGQAFAERFDATPRMWRKAYTARSAGAALLDEMATSCDAVITGFGV